MGYKNLKPNNRETQGDVQRLSSLLFNPLDASIIPNHAENVITEELPMI